MVSGDRMSKKSKRDGLILEKPIRSDISFKVMHNFLLDSGFIVRKSRNGGSHRVYEHPKYQGIVNIQNNEGLVKKYQVNQIQKIIYEIKDIGGE